MGDMSTYFHSAADFIDEGRRQGGVVVHCAVGVSRAPTCVISYLMIKHQFSLKAAFLQVFEARPCIAPNPGFWYQLWELETSLLALGAPLLGPSKEMLQKARLGFSSKGLSRGDPWRSGDPLELLEQLDLAASRRISMATDHISVRVHVSDTSKISGVKERVLCMGLLVMIYESIVEVADPPGLMISARLMPSMQVSSI